MYALETSSNFDAAHFLSNYDGKCANIHGHRWQVVLSVKGDIKEGMLVDFNELKKSLKEECDFFDHTFIVESGSLDENILEALKKQFLIREVPFRTTAENFSKYFYDKLKLKYNVLYVEVYETPNNKARYYEGN